MVTSPRHWFKRLVATSGFAATQPMHLFRVAGDVNMSMSDSVCVIHIMRVLILELGKLARTARNIWIRLTIKNSMKTPPPDFNLAGIK